MVAMPDQDDRPAGLGISTPLHVHFRDERTGCVEHRKTPRRGVFFDRPGNAMSAEDGRCAWGYLIKFFNEYGTKAPQPFDDMSIMDDLMANVDRRAVLIECPFDDLYGSNDARAEAAGVSK
jgi:hypothetical protein